MASSGTSDAIATLIGAILPEHLVQTVCKKLTELGVEDVEDLKYVNPEKQLKDVLKPVQIMRLADGLKQADAKGKMSDERLRIVLIGRAGVGKRSTGNTILRKNAFPVDLSGAEPTRDCTLKGNKRIDVIDTPGLFSNKGCDTGKIENELARSLEVAKPGPHAFVVVLRQGDISKEEMDILSLMENIFGDHVMKFTLVVFVADDDRAKEKSIEQSDLKRLLEKCGGRYLVFNNKAAGDVKEQQANLLINEIQKLKKANGGGAFSSDVNTKKRAETKNTVENLRIVLLGKTGVGKSSTGNTLLGKDEFVVTHYGTSAEPRCIKGINGSLSIVDTPDLFNTAWDQSQRQEEFVRCVELSSPGPHVFVIVLKPGRISQEEMNVVEFLKSTLGDSFVKFTFVAFVGEDDLDADGMSLHEFIEKSHRALRDLLDECGGNRYMIFNNRASDKDRQNQADQFLIKISKIVSESGYYDKDNINYEQNMSEPKSKQKKVGHNQQISKTHKWCLIL